MGIERRPTRPSTGRLPQSGMSGHKRPTARVPQSKTGRMSTSWASLHTQPQKNNTPLILGGVGGGALLLIIIIVAAASSGGSTPRPQPPSNPVIPPVDVSAIENEGLRKCDEGLVMIQSCGTLMSKTELTGSENSQLKTKLTRGKILIEQGMRKLDEAYEKTHGKNKYSTRQYTQ